MVGVSMSEQEERVKKELIKERALLVAQLINTMARLLQNIIAREASMSDLGLIVRASISAAYDTLKESIAEQEAEEELQKYAKVGRISPPAFADAEAQDKFDKLSLLAENGRLKDAMSHLKKADDLEPRLNNRESREMKRMTSSGRRRLKKAASKRRFKLDR